MDLGKASTKILVRNITFQAKKEEIVQLFRTFGEISAVRLPKKMAGTGEHRGFAFIEFSSKKDAASAFSSSRFVYFTQTTTSGHSARRAPRPSARCVTNIEM